MFLNFKTALRFDIPLATLPANSPYVSIRTATFQLYSYSAVQFITYIETDDPDNNARNYFRMLLDTVEIAEIKSPNVNNGDFGSFNSLSTRLRPNHLYTLDLQYKDTGGTPGNVYIMGGQINIVCV